jgi:putative flippase GtrA
VAPWLTVIVPTRNEQGSIEPLLKRLAPALGDVPTDILFVDDSTDDTPAVVRGLARSANAAIRLLHRPADERANGLGGAVLAGMRAARSPWAVVMDSDLQHPPELITRMVAVGQARQVDLVVGTRYSDGGRPEGLAGPYRKLVSGATTRLTKALFPRSLALISDPMSGFFAIRLAALNLDGLKPHGFKILLEIAVRERRLRVAQVPFEFGERVAGESKASLREGMRFARHLANLRMRVLSRQVATSKSRERGPRLRRMLLFAAVGVSGLGINEGVLWLMLRYSSQHYLLAATLATESSTLWNWVLTETIVFRGPKPNTRIGRLLRFAALNHVALLLRLPLLALLVEGFGTGVLAGNLVTLTLLFAVRFVIADSAIYAKPELPPATATPRDPTRVVVHLPIPVRQADDTVRFEGVPVEPVAIVPKPRPSKPGSTYLAYRYAIGSVLTVGSQVPLPELEYFRAQWVGNDVDLAVRVGQVGPNRPRARALMTQYASPPSLSYQEHLGRLGTGFEVKIGDRIEVTCSPALAKSPHVLYTNVIEALLRFICVSRGVVLLHSACMELNGSGLLLSARTDTGKTGTVLRMVRDYGALFLSDDMTLVHSSGKVECFPKPLTISHHTLRAVEAGDLTNAEWRRLRLQSRLHSKEGRQFGMMLAGLNIPIMGINAMTQRVVPPPKYPVDRLVECRIAKSTVVRNLFVIERGSPAVADIAFDDMIDTLIENTDDAYGFPPFRHLAPSIVIGGEDYEKLRAKERELLTASMADVRARHVVCDDFSWCDRVAQLVGEESTQPNVLRNAPQHMEGVS